MKTRYVSIADDAPIEVIDAALDDLRIRRAAVHIDVIHTWISADMDALLEMRKARMHTCFRGGEPWCTACSTAGAL